MSRFGFKDLVFSVVMFTLGMGFVFSYMRYDTLVKQMQSLESKMDTLANKPVATGNLPQQQYLQAIETRLNELEKVQDLNNEKLSSISKDSSKAQSEQTSPNASGAGGIVEDDKLKEIVKKQVEQSRAEEREKRNQDWGERMKVEGVAMVEKGIGTPLTEAQKEAIAPFFTDYSKKTQNIWWESGRDESGKVLTYDEKVKRSDEIRAEIYAKMKMSLTSSQAQQFDNWIKIRNEKRSKNEEVEGTGPLRWF